jgi:outer membrane usher protein
MAGVAGIFMSCTVCAQDARSVQFDAGFLPDGLAMGLDLSRYAHGNPVLPGVYDVDIWMNDEWQVRRAVRFVERYTGNDASPCLSRAELESFGLVKKEPSSAEDDCAPISERIPQSTARLDVAEQRLDIEVPQAWLVRRPRGVAPREQWKDGVTAALLAWRANFH